MISTPSISKDQKLMRQVDQIEAMRDEQRAGLENLETIPGNRNPKYQVRKDEADRYVFIFTRIKHVSTMTKSINNEDRIIPIHKAEFDRKVDEGYFAIYDEVSVIHDPRDGAPMTYDIAHKEGQVNIVEPRQPRADAAQLKEQREALRLKEQELLAKQKELEEREAKLNPLTE